MKFFVIKGKYFFGIIFLACLISSVLIKTASPAFKVGNRELPIYSVQRQDNKASITFNCAWGDEDISEILQILDKYNVKATFFIVGSWASKYPDKVKEIFDAGHEIANHSLNHSHYKNMNKEQILNDIEKCDKILENITLKKPCLVRGPYGEYNDDTVKVCEETGRFCIQWSVDSIDYSAKSKEEIISRVTSKAENGSIILMHTGTEHTKNALPEILDNLTRNYELVKVSDLIYKEDYEIDAIGVQKKIKFKKRLNLIDF